MNFSQQTGWIVLDQIRTVNRRRFIKKLGSLDVKTITEVKGLENLTNLSHLSLENNLLRDVKGLDNLTNLKEVDLSAGLFWHPSLKLLKVK
ncbi:MAG: type II toxin-antitoxin system PemK/MazF family toxin [Promethearchaeota archaeon]